MAADESERAGRGNAGLVVFSGASQELGAYNPPMPAIALPKLAQTIAEEVATLPEDKQCSVMDYVMFMKQRVEENGDAAWERITNDPRPRPKLQAFMEAAMAEGSEPLDLSKF
jgi:hypothetical protein